MRGFNKPRHQDMGMNSRELASSPPASLLSRHFHVAVCDRAALANDI